MIELSGNTERTAQVKMADPEAIHTFHGSDPVDVQDLAPDVCDGDLGRRLWSLEGCLRAPDREPLQCFAIDFAVVP